MDKYFEVKIPSGGTLKGRSFMIEGAKRNLLIQTGMGEHSLRYGNFAKYLNGLGFNVCVMDAVGQGLNAPNPDDQEKWMEGAFDKNVEALHEKIMELRSNGLPTSLFGHSMGSFMTQRYLERYPGTLDSVVICGSNGPQPVKMFFSSIVMKLLTTKKNWDKHSPFCETLGLGGYTKAFGKPKQGEPVYMATLAWLSKDVDNIRDYAHDPYCGAPTTHGFWKEFTKGLRDLNRKKEMKRVSKDEHILIVSGDKDPVGEMGKGLRRLYKSYKKRGVKDVTLILYPDLRHEILNEKEKDRIYKDISDFLLSH